MLPFQVATARHDPLTVTDAHSRCLLCCEGVRGQDEASARVVFERVFREFDLPGAMRSDNGVPFATTGVGGLSRLIVLAAATAVALGAFLRRTMLGRAIRAVAQDRQAAILIGVNAEQIYMITFGAGAALAGLAGCLPAPIYTLSPQIGTNFILPAFAVVVLGGLGSVLGAYVGGFIVGMTEALAGYYLDPALKHAVLFAVFILVLIVRPSGLFGQPGAEQVGLRGHA